MTEASPALITSLSCANRDLAAPLRESRESVVHLLLQLLLTCTHTMHSTGCDTSQASLAQISFSRFRHALAATLAQCVVDPEHDTCSHLAWRMRCPASRWPSLK
jgi:hypothetical protein